MLWYSIYNKREQKPPQTSGGFAAEIPFFVWNPAAVITAAGFLFSEKNKVYYKKRSSFCCSFKITSGKLIVYDNLQIYSTH